ncbi:MAG: hypothetical protein M1823_006470 [Watsoniomyces obsoletus]|nr:MAG: hypothetical protein M1823_006470 [Watsoniomyces obsoletus]
MAKSEIWVTLQNINALLLRLFPPEAHGTDQRAAVLMKLTVATETEFQTHMFCEFLRYGCWNKSAKIWRVAVEWHALAIRTINENLKDPTKALSDSNIHAVWALALHKLQKVDFASDNDKPRPSQGPLKALHLLEYVGGPVEPSAVHRAAWLKMLRLRGGLQSLKSSEYAHLMSQ